MEQIEGQNEIDSCVITNKRNRDRKARNKVKLSFQIAEDVAAPDKDHVDNEGSEDNSNDSECDYDPKDDDYEPDEEDYDPEEDYDHEDENCDPEDEDYDPEDKNCDPEDKNCDPEDKNCDPEDVDWNSHGEEWSYRETGWNECQLCGRRLTRKTYQYHVKNHDKMRYKCMCGWMFEEKTRAHSHAISIHSIHITKHNIEEYTISGQNSGPYGCTKCGRKLLGEKNYHDHVDDHDKMKWGCVCGWMFKNKSLLQSHAFYWHQISVTENNIHNFICDSSKFVSTDALLAENQASTTCPLCGRENLSEKLYEHHVKNHKKLGYKCNEPNCGWVFEVEYGLWYHMQMKHRYNSTVLADVNVNEGNFIAKEESLENENKSNSSEGNGKSKLINESESIENGCNRACGDENAHSSHTDEMPILTKEEEEETNRTRDELIEQLVAYL